MGQSINVQDYMANAATKQFNWLVHEQEISFLSFNLTQDQLLKANLCKGRCVLNDLITAGQGGQ